MDLLNTCLALCCHLVIKCFVIVVVDNENDVDDDARVFVYLICGFPQASLPRSPPSVVGKHTSPHRRSIQRSWRGSSL